jgi:hypothetical protein
VNKFRSEADRRGRWGDLPGRARDPILHDPHAWEDFPAEYQEMLKEYQKRLAEEEE